MLEYSLFTFVNGRVLNALNAVANLIRILLVCWVCLIAWGYFMLSQMLCIFSQILAQMLNCSLLLFANALYNCCGKSRLKAKIAFKLSSRLANRFQPFCLMLYRIAILLAIVASDFFNVFCVV